jgi:hypothetical protein
MALLANLGALATLLLGLLGLFRPRMAARLISIVPEGKLGLSEVRATYGGLFTALAVVCLMAQRPTVFLSAAAAWLGAGCARIFSLMVDQSYSPKNLGGILLELIIGGLLLAGAV